MVSSGSDNKTWPTCSYMRFGESRMKELVGYYMKGKRQVQVVEEAGAYRLNTYAPWWSRPSSCSCWTSSRTATLFTINFHYTCWVHPKTIMQLQVAGCSPLINFTTLYKPVCTWYSKLLIARVGTKILAVPYRAHYYLRYGKLLPAGNSPTSSFLNTSSPHIVGLQYHAK